MPVGMRPDNCSIGKMLSYAFQGSALFDRNIRTVDKDITQFRGGHFLTGQDQVIIRAP